MNELNGHANEWKVKGYKLWCFSSSSQISFQLLTPVQNIIPSNIHVEYPKQLVNTKLKRNNRSSVGRLELPVVDLTSLYNVVNSTAHLGHYIVSEMSDFPVESNWSPIRTESALMVQKSSSPAESFSLCLRQKSYLLWS